MTPIYEAMIHHFGNVQDKIGECCQGLGIDELLLDIKKQGGGYLKFPHTEDAYNNNTAERFCMQMNPNADMMEHVVSAYLFASFSNYITMCSNDSHRYLDLLCELMNLPVELAGYALYCTSQTDKSIHLDHLRSLTEKIATARELQLGSRKRFRTE